MVPDNDPTQGQPAANPGTNPPINRPSTPTTDNAGYEREAARKAAYDRQAEQREGNAKEAAQDHLVEGKNDAERFRHMIRNSVSHMTGEQRTIIREELQRLDQVQPVDGKKVPSPTAELEANEADKIKRAEEAVSTRIPPAPPAGGEGVAVGAGRADVLDMSQYEKIGEQWRMCLGSVAGHMQYRWLSDAEAKAIGLEVPKGVNERIDQLGPLDLKQAHSPLRPADAPEGFLD